MRRLAVLAGLGAVVLGVGCLPGCKRDVVPDPPAVITTEKPTAASLVAYLNDNARLMESVKSTQVQIDAKQGTEAIGLEGTLFCQKPRNFRLRAKALGQPAVDIGSNDDEFWFWISQAKDEDNVARVHYCSYKDMAAGKARMPFPFQPDMIVAALGIGVYDPNGQYTLKEDAKTLSLIEQAVSAQGQAVQKVTVFNKVRVGPGKPQVVAYLLLDGKTGAEICRASVLEVQTVQVDRENKAVLPQKVQLVWKPQQIEMTMRLFDTQANSIAAPQAAKLFSRADLASIPAANLARGSDTPSGYSQEPAIQPARLNAPVK
jgi:hypothetical protein